MMPVRDLSQQYAELKARYEASGGEDWEAGAELEKLYETAQTLGTAYFENSDEVAMLNRIEEAEVNAICENTAELKEATQASYRMSQVMSRGLASTFKPSFFTLGDYEDDGGNLHLVDESSTSGWYDDGGNFHPHAFGLDRVPYDGYPALLHQGERVLTASEARAQDAGQGAAPIQIPITGNTFMGLPEEVADQIAGIIARKMKQAAIAAAPK